MWFQTGSAWISLFGMAEISISLPMSYFVYTYLFRIEYFDFLCSLSLCARPSIAFEFHL